MVFFLGGGLFSESVSNKNDDSPLARIHWSGNQGMEHGYQLSLFYLMIHLKMFALPSPQHDSAILEILVSKEGIFP